MLDNPVPPTGNQRPPTGESTPARRPIYRDWNLLQFALLVFLLDQFTKFLVVSFLPYRSSYPDFGFFRFTHTHNTGSAFGILQGMNTPLIFVSFIGVFVLIMIYRSQPHPGLLLRMSLALQLGGAFGNLVDRVRLSWVTDFIDIGPWPVFNLADASIVTGLIMLGWILTRPSHTVPAASERATGESASDGPDWCPVCDGEVTPLPGGWRCATCGVQENTGRRYVPLAIVRPAEVAASHRANLADESGVVTATPAGFGESPPGGAADEPPPVDTSDSPSGYPSAEAEATAAAPQPAEDDIIDGVDEPIDGPVDYPVADGAEPRPPDVP